MKLQIDGDAYAEAEVDLVKFKQHMKKHFKLDNAIKNSTKFLKNEKKDVLTNDILPHAKAWGFPMVKCKNCGKETNITCLCGVCPECNDREGHDVIFKKFQESKGD